MTELKDNMELVYRQVSCQKAVNGTNFSQGVQDYNWSIGGRTGWIPNRSYFRIGLTLTGAGGAAQPTYKEQIALADNVCGNLFNNIYFRAGGQDASSIVNYAPIASALKNRLDKPKAWLDSVGSAAFFNEPDFSKRSARTAASLPTVMDGTLQTTKLSTAGFANTYTVSIAADTGVVTGTNTDFVNQGLAVGDGLLVNGTIFTVTVVTNATTCTVEPAPSADVDTLADGSALKVSRENDGGGKNVVYVMYQPPIGIFDRHVPMGSGDYRLQLNPNAYYKTSAVEMKLGGQVAPTNFDISVDSIEFYVATCKQDIPPTGVETLHLMESQVQSKTITNTTGENLLDYTIPSSTKAITVFVQSGDSGSNVQIPPSVFKTKDGSDTLLSSIQLSYANQVKPSTRWTSEYNATTNKLTQRYLDTQFESGKFWSSGGCESFGDWIKRGPYYHYNWVRDADDRSTQLQVSVNFGGAGIEAGANLFVVAHYTRTVQIDVTNGFVSSVNSLSV